MVDFDKRFDIGIWKLKKTESDRIIFGKGNLIQGTGAIIFWKRPKLRVFKGRQVRRTIYKDEWYFSIVDIIEALTGSDNPRNYWNMMKAREKQQSEVQLSTFCVQLKLTSSDGKSYKTDCAKTGKRIILRQNYLQLPQNKKRLKGSE